ELTRQADYQTDVELKAKINDLLQKYKQNVKWTESYSQVVIQWLNENVPLNNE
ncbi:unnamed protein product, partial [Schistosoma turkestanicum]